MFEAEYEIENGRANWNCAVRETMAWHGSFKTEAEANEVARARMWSKIDICAHKARVVDLTEKQ